jgi:hypothetical protein
MGSLRPPLEPAEVQRYFRPNCEARWLKQ